MCIEASFGKRNPDTSDTSYSSNVLFQRDVAALGESVADFDWSTRVTRVSLTWYPEYHKSNTTDQ